MPVNQQQTKTVVGELETNSCKCFKKYRKNDDLKIAMVLDPRFKLKYVEESQEADKNSMKEILFQECFFYSECHLKYEKEIEETECEATDAMTESGEGPSSALFLKPFFLRLKIAKNNDLER